MAWLLPKTRRAGALCQLQKQPRVFRRRRSEQHDRLVAEQLALTVEPREQPAQEWMEKENGEDQVQSELRPIVAASEVCQLVQQTGTPIRLGPIRPIRRDQDQRHNPTDDNWRRDLRMQAQPETASEPNRALALAHQS